MTLRSVPHAFAHLSDVDVDGLADGDGLVWDASAGRWVPHTATGERLVQDGSAPPVDLTLEDESDYLYEDV